MCKYKTACLAELQVVKFLSVLNLCIIQTNYLQFSQTITRIEENEDGMVDQYHVYLYVYRVRHIYTYAAKLAFSTLDLL